ncbi:hypothetical protein J7337_009277 [Fusarium musae]|uniref:Uncharacterized protein n=1 Tax=Fusarium musae TaxID=1042133 RepID=A0A9P8IM33_9HYPO|nr:hypothetical protein J7337_009277 [Fusarium musae]KAG9498472.1 hypothetical protein J7337_009277 [Fusarium musae]
MPKKGCSTCDDQAASDLTKSEAYSDKPGCKFMANYNTTGAAKPLGVSVCEMAEDEKTLAQLVEVLKKENLQQRRDLDDCHEMKMRQKRENESLQLKIRRLQEEFLEDAERYTRITKAYRAIDSEEKEELQEENRALKQALADVESAIAPLKKL